MDPLFQLAMLFGAELAGQAQSHAAAGDHPKTAQALDALTQFFSIFATVPPPAAGHVTAPPVLAAVQAAAAVPAAPAKV